MDNHFGLNFVLNNILTKRKKIEQLFAIYSKGQEWGFGL